MLSVIFEVRPSAGQWDSYLGKTKLLRPELEQLPGLVDHLLYKSLTRSGWILWLMSMRDEQSVMELLALMSRHEARDLEGGKLLSECQLRVGHLAFDTRSDGLVAGAKEPGIAMTPAITVNDALQWPDWVASHNAEEIALYLGFDLNSFGDCTSWDVFDSLFSPGSIMLLANWKDKASALGFAQSALVPDDARVRAVEAVRGFGPFHCRGESACHTAAAGPRPADDRQQWRNASNDR